MDQKLGIIGLMAGLAGVAAAKADPQAEVRLYCYSLRFDKAEESLFGVTSSLELGTAGGNGELTPVSGNPNRGSGFVLETDQFPQGLPGSIFFNTPAFRDVNGNGFDDFFESSEQVNPSQTSGAFTTDLEDGTVQATWSRVAGSATGSCVLEMEGAIFGVLPTFTHHFELIEYEGTLTYEPGETEVRGTLELMRTGNPEISLTGEVSISRNPVDPVNQIALTAGSWRDQEDRLVAFDNTLIDRDLNLSTNYFGRIVFQDGEPETAAPDFRTWMLSIDDPNDTDGDGIPDLSDNPVTPPPSPPHLALAVDDQELRLTLNGETGRTYTIETSPTVKPGVWTVETTVTLASESQVVSWPRAGGDHLFIRASAP